MANKSIQTENYLIIANGSVMTFAGEKLLLEFTDSQNTPFKVNFIFEENKERGQDVQARPNNDGNILNVTIYNAEKSGGMTSPLQITTDDAANKAIFLSIHFQKVSNYFVVQYTFFQKK